MTLHAKILGIMAVRHAVRDARFMYMYIISSCIGTHATLFWLTKSLAWVSVLVYGGRGEAQELEIEAGSTLLLLSRHTYSHHPERWTAGSSPAVEANKLEHGNGMICRFSFFSQFWWFEDKDVPSFWTHFKPSCTPRRRNILRST